MRKKDIYQIVEAIAEAYDSEQAVQGKKNVGVFALVAFYDSDSPEVNEIKFCTTKKFESASPIMRVDLLGDVLDVLEIEIDSQEKEVKKIMAEAVINED